jgi:hypothetical protein
MTITAPPVEVMVTWFAAMAAPDHSTSNALTRR